MLREAARKQKQAIDNYNRQVQTHNRELDNRRRAQVDAINKYNQEVYKQNQKVVTAINQHNRNVAIHNQRVHSNQQRLAFEIRRLSQRTISPQYTNYHLSVQSLSRSYERLNQDYETHNRDENFTAIVELSEREAANNVGVLNRLLDDTDVSQEVEADDDDSNLGNELKTLSLDLDSRWAGAVFSLNPRNPDAARHFCTSAREIIATILDIKAPNETVKAQLPQCAFTPQGTPTRRSKIRFILSTNSLQDAYLEDFVDQDIQNVVDLFDVFNSATHGSAGTFNLQQLKAVRKRVEDAIHFLFRLSGKH